MNDDCSFYCYQKTRRPIKNPVDTVEKIEIILFDMDGVLADTVSSWKFIHDYFKTDNEKSVDDYMQGRIDYAEFIRRDVELWKQNNGSITTGFLRKILRDVPLMKGAKKTFDSIKKYDVKTAIVSGGLDILADQLAKILGIDYVFANGLKTDKNGFITGVGVVGVDLMYKDEIVVKISKDLGIPQSCIASVGNSCLDIPMFRVCGLGVAFNPSDDCVRDEADYVVEGKDITRVIPIFEKHI